MPRSRSLVPMLVVIVSAMLLAAGSAVQAEYLAYAVTKDGEVPLPEDVQAITKKNAKKLVSVRWGDYQGPKIRVGVMEADNKSSVGTYRYSGPAGEYSGGYDYNQVPVNGIDALLTDAMVKTGRFRVLTRTELGEVLDEQDLGASGRVAKPSAAKIGKVLGAEYLIQLVVNSYEPNVSGKKGGLGGFSRKLRAVGGIKGGKGKSYVSTTVKLIDAETTEVIASEVVEASISEMSLGLGGVGWGSAGALGGFLSGYSKTPVGQAMIAAVNAGVFELVKQIGNKPLSGSVVKVEDTKVIVNLGTGYVTAGEKLMAVSKGEEFVDPDTGLSLGADEEEIGLLEVTDVKEKYCYAKPVGFETAKLKRGDKIATTREPAPLQFGAAW